MDISDLMNPLNPLSPLNPIWDNNTGSQSVAAEPGDSICAYALCVVISCIIGAMLMEWANAMIEKWKLKRQRSDD